MRAFLSLSLSLCLFIANACATAGDKHGMRVAVTLLWQQEMPESFDFGVSATGDRILVRCGDYPGKNYLVLYDQAGKELWRVGPVKGRKLFGPGISADGTRAVYTENWPAKPGSEEYPIITKVMLLDATTGRPIQGKEFPAGSWKSAQISSDGKFLLCHDMSMEEPGGWARLYRIDTPVWKELWRLENVTPTLNVTRTDAKGRKIGAFPLFSDAQFLGGKSDTVMSARNSLFQIDQQGHRHWRLDTGKGDAILAAVSPDNDLFVVQSEQYEPWPVTISRQGPDFGEPLVSKLTVKHIRLSIYLIGDWRRQPEPQAARLIAGINWPEGVLTDEAAADFAGAAITRDGDVAVLAAFSSARSMLYRIPLYPKEEGAPAAESVDLGMTDNQVWAAWSRAGLLAVSSTGEKIDAYHRRARFTLFDLYGNKLWEDASREGDHQFISLSTNGTLLFAQAGNALYCYQIQRLPEEQPKL